jgi:hypothetical protein
LINESNINSIREIRYTALSCICACDEYLDCDYERTKTRQNESTPSNVEDDFSTINTNTVLNFNNHLYEKPIYAISD